MTEAMQKTSPEKKRLSMPQKVEHFVTLLSEGGKTATELKDLTNYSSPIIHAVLEEMKNFDLIQQVGPRPSKKGVPGAVWGLQQDHQVGLKEFRTVYSVAKVREERSHVPKQQRMLSILSSLQDGELTKKELARITGLTYVVVSKYVTDLKWWKLVESVKEKKEDRSRGAKGRLKIYWRLAEGWEGQLREFTKKYRITIGELQAHGLLPESESAEMEEVNEEVAEAIPEETPIEVEATDPRIAALNGVELIDLRSMLEEVRNLTLELNAMDVRIEYLEKQLVKEKEGKKGLEGTMRELKGRIKGLLEGGQTAS